MAAWYAIPLVGDLVKGLFGLVDKAVEDKDEANKLKADLETVMEKSDLSKFRTDMEARAGIVLGEIKGKSWLQRNWRPILMLAIVAIVVNNYILFPYMSLFTDKAVILDLPEKLWNLMMIGVGGYIAGRSGEKIVSNWKQGG